ncbi:hypothetical protein KI387_044150 [Taxus chinensis]|uniref:Reverse transcriptase domain-containing protein n=1 Tax=Taxus chinensis TaxID=29808 RepID=A0AA38BYR1_TAXCH|nr:hypothetical protein KI387_044150 [Taxus chinensis]
MVNIGKCCSPKEKRRFFTLFKKYSDVLAYYYDELKSFQPKEMHHSIRLNQDAKPFRQKQRPYNPKITDTIKEEVMNMLNARIIFPIHHSTWVANIVPVWKKNGKIRICVDFHNLNQASLKDNYPLPIMDHFLQGVIESEILSLLDGFLGYNQIKVVEEDRAKITFTMPWGTFSYSRMPFGIINVGATFQMAMELAFRDLKNCIFIYLDDLTVFSKKRGDHTHHLEQVLARYRKHGISLNPKKCIFRVMEGKLLGHIVNKHGAHIDPERVRAIKALSLPTSKKGFHSFFRKVNFLRHFVPEFAELTKHITTMMKP